jgi:FkbM family methyltransferase
MNYYSSNGVDKLIEPLLPEFGMACDVGANDGQFFSNSLHFEEKGWIVLCVEPNPRLRHSGIERRKLWRSVAAGEKDGWATFRICGEYPYASLSGFHASPGDGDEIQVPRLRLDRILEEAGFHRLDMLTIDVELHEPQVLAGFTLERWKPTILVVEDQAGKMEPPPGYESLGHHEFDWVFKRS